MLPVLWTMLWPSKSVKLYISYKFCAFVILTSYWQRRVSYRVFLLYLEHLVPLPIRILYILNIFIMWGVLFANASWFWPHEEHISTKDAYIFLYRECIELHIIISYIALYIEMGYPFNLKLCDLLIQAHEWFWYIIILNIEYCICSHFGSADLQFRLDDSIFNISISYQILNPPMIMLMVMMMLSNSKRFHLKLSQYGIQCICICPRLSQVNNDDICQNK